MLRQLALAGLFATPAFAQEQCAGVADALAGLAETPDEAALRTGDLVIRQRDAACK